MGEEKRTLHRVTDEDRERVRQCFEEGMGRNQIADATGLAAGTVSRLAKEMGLSFDRSETAAATAARKADLAAMRSQLALDLLKDAQRLRRQMWQPAVVYAFGGKDNDYNEHDVDEPPPADKRALMMTAAAAIDRSLKLSPPTDGTSLDDAKSMLGRLGEALIGAFQDEDEGTDDGDDEA